MPTRWRSEFTDSPAFLSSSSERRLPGLTVEETKEFEALDALAPFDDSGAVAWTFEGQPTNRREKRWLELYTKIEMRRSISHGKSRGRAMGLKGPLQPTPDTNLAKMMAEFIVLRRTVITAEARYRARSLSPRRHP